jgi:hypothetical protein
MMDSFEKAFKLGQYKAHQNYFHKEASAKDMAHLLSFLGEGASKGVSGLGKALSKGLGGAQATGRGAKYLGVTADPRKALAAGVGLAGLSTIAPALVDDAALLSIQGMKNMAPGAIASLGAGLAAGANPGLMGGSSINRITHELAMASATPAGTLATMVGLVGLPAALIGYGKMKGKEESSLF